METNLEYINSLFDSDLSDLEVAELSCISRIYITELRSDRRKLETATFRTLVKLTNANKELNGIQIRRNLGLEQRLKI